MQLEQQETFRIEGPQLELLGQAESKLPAPARKRPVAAAAIVLAAVLAVFGIGGAKLSGAYRSTQAIYASANEHGQGMENDLALRADAAANLIRLCAQKLGEQDATVQAAQQALDDWNATDSAHPADQFAANTALGGAVTAMVQQTQDTAGSSDAIDGQYTEFLSRQDIILRAAANEYNPAAQSFNDTVSGFPANLIGALWDVGEVELFQ